jgi:hypothetical protein
MTSDSANGGYRLTAWVVGGSALVALALVAAAIVWSWHLKIVAIGLQLLGIGLTLLGVAVVRSWLERAAHMTGEAKRGLDRLWAQSRERLRVWWSRRRGRPVVVHVSASDSATVTDSATATVTRYRVDRQTVADRDWLVHLDDRVYGLVEQLDKLEQARISEQAEWRQRLADQRDEMRDEMLAATRQGWELIVGGLVWSAVGTALWMAA